MAPPTVRLTISRSPETKSACLISPDTRSGRSMMSPRIGAILPVTPIVRGGSFGGPPRHACGDYRDRARFAQPWCGAIAAGGRGQGGKRWDAWVGFRPGVAIERAGKVSRWRRGFPSVGKEVARGERLGG